MKRIAYIPLIVVAITLLWPAVVVRKVQQVSSAQSQASPLIRFEQSPTGAGTLAVVRNSQGEEILGEKNPTNEGYAIAYEVPGDSRESRKRMVYAMANTYSKGLLECEECERRNAELRKLNPNYAVATAVTSDHALMITSSFKFDSQTQRLAVHRIIENISNDSEVRKRNRNAGKVKLLSVRLQSSPLLWAGIAPQAGIPRQFKNQTLNDSPQFKKFASNLRPAGWLAFTSTCGWCPTECDPPLDLRSSSVTTICVSCPGEYDETLLPPGLSEEERKKAIGYQFKSGFMAASEECDHPVTIGQFGSFNADVTVGKQGVLVCANCSPFSMNYVQNTGSAARASLKDCDICVDVSKTVTFSDLNRGEKRNLPAVPSQFLQAKSKSQRRVTQHAPLPLQELKPGDRIEVVTVYNLKGK